MNRPVFSSPYALKVWASHACFSDPELKPDHYSYAVPPHSVARSIFRCIQGKDAVRWHVEECRILKPIRRQPFMGNHLKDVPGCKSFSAKGLRTQTRTQYLVDVEYIFLARLEQVEFKEPFRKFTAMYEQAAKRGKVHDHHPYLGESECLAFWEPVRIEDLGSYEPISLSKDFGWMSFDEKLPPHGSGLPSQHYMFHAVVKDGILRYPSSYDVFASGRKLGGPTPDRRRYFSRKEVSA